jgi:hypothetical protein
LCLASNFQHQKSKAERKFLHLACSRAFKDWPNVFKKCI